MRIRAREKNMLLICFIPVIGPGIVFLLTAKELTSAKKWNSGFGFTALFLLLFLISWIISLFLTAACAVLFSGLDETYITLLMVGFICILTPWPMWGYHIWAENYIEKHRRKELKKISDEDKSKFV